MEIPFVQSPGIFDLFLPITLTGLASPLNLRRTYLVKSSRKMAELENQMN